MLYSVLLMSMPWRRLRCGKVTDFEGGVRAVSFMGGGYVPVHLRGSRFEGMIAVADWCECIDS